MQGIRDTTRHGFTLVELAIVLVIIGLLVGGVLVGNDMIRAAETQRITRDIGEYQVALDQFYAKYTGLPGDITNATSIWGEAHSDPATCATTQGTGTQTCNGNGDGQVYNAAHSAETLRAWQQMVNAGLIKGYYTGILGSGFTEKAGVNVPAAGPTEAIIGFFYHGTLSANATHFDCQCGNVFWISVVTAAGSGRPFLTPAETKQIDDKIDDGRPATGRMRSTKQSAPGAYPNCTTSDTITAQYNVTDSSPRCAFQYVTGY